MPKLLTPARLAALVGVLTGIGVVLTALLNVFPSGSGLGKGLAAAGGAIGTAITIGKWLEGQAGWEQLQAVHAHEKALTNPYAGKEAVFPVHAANWKNPTPKPEYPPGSRAATSQALVDAFQQPEPPFDVAERFALPEDADVERELG